MSEYSWLSTLLRILAFSGGALLLYLAVFLYEDEEGDIQNRLEVLWLRLSVVERAQLQKSAAVFRLLAQRAELAVDSTFGSKFLSLQAVVASSQFSVLSVSTLLIWSIITEDVPNKLRSPAISIAVATALAICSILSVSAFRRLANGQLGASTLLTVITLGLLCFYSFFFGWWDYLIIPVGIAGDLVFIALVRVLLGRVSRVVTTLRLVINALICCLITMLLAVLPYYYVTKHYDFFTDSGWHFLPMVLAATNLLETLVATALAAVLLILLAHRLLWPFLSRSIYSLSRYQIIKRKKMLGALGVVLIGMAFPAVGKVLEKAHALVDGKIPSMVDTPTK